jgi:hypothetical protein
MGGFSASVQQDLNNTPPPPPNAVMGNMGRDVLQGIAGKGGASTPPPTSQPVALPAVMPPSGSGKGSGGQPDQNIGNSQPAQYSPPDGTMGGKGSSTNSATSGQPRMGQPNNYANTIPQWDNASQQLTQPAKRSGKGKGG